MAWDPTHARAQVEDLETILGALDQNRGITDDELRTDLNRRWAVEHGMLLTADTIFDMLNYILDEKFGSHPKSYEDTLMRAHSHGLLDSNTYGRLRGLGNFRNMMAHPRLTADVGRYRYNFEDALALVPRVIEQLRDWLAKQ